MPDNGVEPRLGFREERIKHAAVMTWSSRHADMALAELNAKDAISCQIGVGANIGSVFERTISHWLRHGHHSRVLDNSPILKIWIVFIRLPGVG